MRYTITLRITHCSYRKSIAALTITVINKGLATILDTVHRVTFITASLKDRQSTYNVTLRRVRVTIVAVQQVGQLHILSVCP